MDRDTRRVILTGDLTTRGTPRQRAKRVARPSVTLDGMYAAAIRGAMDRRFKSGHAIDPDWVEAVTAIVDRAGGRCELTGLAFRDGYSQSGRRRPWLPTLDRIDAARGYEPVNMRLVCCAANIAVNDWGDDVFFEMVDAAYRKRYG